MGVDYDEQLVRGTEADAAAGLFDDFLTRGRAPRYADELSHVELEAVLATLDEDERAALMRSLAKGS